MQQLQTTHDKPACYLLATYYLSPTYPLPTTFFATRNCVNF